MKRYYSTQRPVDIGTYPKEGAQYIMNFGHRAYVEEIHRWAWGYIEYDRALSLDEMVAYELRDAPDSDEISEQIHALFKALVPASGKADTVAGEMIRAFCRLEYRFFNDGDMTGVGYGRETCNAAARYLSQNKPLYGYNDEAIERCIYDLWWCYGDEQEYGIALEHLAAAVLDCIELHPELKTMKNDVDMWDYFDADEDRDDTEEDDWDE